MEIQWKLLPQHLSPSTPYPSFQNPRSEPSTTEPPEVVTRRPSMTAWPVEVELYMALMEAGPHAARELASQYHAISLPFVGTWTTANTSTSNPLLQAPTPSMIATAAPRTPADPTATATATPAPPPTTTTAAATANPLLPLVLLLLLLPQLLLLMLGNPNHND